MKEELEVFDEWFCKRFDAEDVPDLLEFIALRDTISFQSYLAWYRFKKLCRLLGEPFIDLFDGMISGIKWLFKRWFE